MQNRIPSSSGPNWEAVFAICGSRGPLADFLDTSSPWFPNSTFTDCANRLLSHARGKYNIEEDFLYVVFLTDPTRFSVLKADFLGMKVPVGSAHFFSLRSIFQLADSEFRALEMLLESYAPPVLCIRRHDAPLEFRQIFIDIAGDMEFGMVAIHTSTLDLLLPFRFSEMASWMVSVCVFWATARAAFSDRMYRVNDMLAWERSKEFLRIHYHHDSSSRRELWSDACERGTDLVCFLAGHDDFSLVFSGYVCSDIRCCSGCAVGGPRSMAGWSQGEGDACVWKTVALSTSQRYI